MARGLVVGFLAGVVLTLILAGSTAYYVYTQIQRRLSSEGTQQAVETQLVSLLGEGARVESAQVTFPNLITLNNLSISNATGTILSVEKIEAAAEGGVTGLQQGRFIEVVLTRPVIALEKRHGRWNLRDLIDPLLARTTAGANASSSTSTRASLPLRMVQIKEPKLTVAMENQPFQEYEAETLVCSREDHHSAWSLFCQGAHVRLNSTSESFPFGDLVNSMQDLVVSRSGNSTAPPVDAGSWLAGVTMENTSLELNYPQQNIIIEGISFQADRLFETLKLQTGSLEKKNDRSGA